MLPEFVVHLGRNIGDELREKNEEHFEVPVQWLAEELMGKAVVFSGGPNPLEQRLLARKGYHSKRSTGVSEEVGCRRMKISDLAAIDSHDLDGGVGAMWVPHERTGIYYPQGQERVMDDIPMEAAAAGCLHMEEIHQIHPFSCNKAVRSLSAAE
ncbi:hypothetical protein ACLOJK_040526 [Asimina triloba]